jgi:hypothetical protein
MTFVQHLLTQEKRVAVTAETSVPGASASDRQSAAANDAGGPVPPRRSRAGAEAARYGVLRRLAPALKHDMVVNLQAISMMAEVLNAKLERGSPAPAEFHASIAKLNRLARDAVANCLKVASWIEPGEDEGVRLDKAWTTASRCSPAISISAVSWSSRTCPRTGSRFRASCCAICSSRR